MECVLWIREVLHYFLHLIFPVFVAKVFFRNHWKKAYFLMLATMLVDLDHIFANPVFDPNRSSIGFHPLHTYPWLIIYAVGSIFLKGNYRMVAVGLLLHMATDFQDYYLWNMIYCMN